MTKRRSSAVICDFDPPNASDEDATVAAADAALLSLLPPVTPARLLLLPLLLPSIELPGDEVR